MKIKFIKRQQSKFSEEVMGLIGNEMTTYYEIVITQTSPVLQTIKSNGYLHKRNAECEADMIRASLHHIPSLTINVVEVNVRPTQAQ